MKKLNSFHLAIPVQNLALCREFYGQTLGCAEGRSAEKWVDFNFFGHQLVIHKTSKSQEADKPESNPVDGHDVPIPHFGVVLDWGEWMDLSERLKTWGIHFIIEPYIRFKGETGEQATMFFLDPDGNALEFKAFKEIDQLFAKD
ncbi:VOC family protein [Roseivirga echinicomitans]|uniref:Glyoxalase n=1 Tax=Roseivirga echinicomitans TaxID=296218 RepID=A0A150XXI3_9BACT|nr:VOC family protein [Roseivirga echinicomitans]KYG83477.1 glyoxalase [Roseivirga echinicomitans]